MEVDSVYVVTATEKQIGLPIPILKRVGLLEGESVRLTTQNWQVIITPLQKQLPAGGVADTAESFTSAELATAYPECGLVRLSQMVLKESPADYRVEESCDAASDRSMEGRLPFHKIRWRRNHDH